MSVTSAQRWIIEHSLEIESWIDNLISQKILDNDDHSYYINLLYNQADMAIRIINDYYKTNIEKINLILDEILNSEYCVSVAYGDPRQGKTAFNYSLLDILHKIVPEIPIYVLGTWKLPPFAKGFLFDLNDIPSNSFVYIAEMAKFFPARESSSQDNRTLSSQLLDLGHFNIKIFGETQKASSCDINIPRYANFKFFKYMDFENLKFEREQVLTPLIEMLLPKNKDDKDLTLALCNSTYLTIRMKQPAFFSKDFSTNLSLVTEDNKLAYARTLLKKGYSAPDTQQRMSVHFRYNKPLQFWKDIQKEI